MKAKNLFSKPARLATGLLLALLISGGAAPALSQSVDDCMECHMDPTLTKTDKDGTVHSLYVDKERYLKDIHGDMGYECIDCHETATADGNHPAEGLPDVTCVTCHEEVAENYNKSPHGQLLAQGNADAPECYDCHTMHEVQYADQPESSVHPDNIAGTCGTCHKNEAAPDVAVSLKRYLQGKEQFTAEQTISSVLSLFAARVKGHGKVDMGCDFSTQRCIDCHYEVADHDLEKQERAVCASCHAEGRADILFGKIHRPNVMTSPLMVVMLIVLYLAGIAALVLFFKGGAPAPSLTKGTQETEKAKETDSGQQE